MADDQVQEVKVEEIKAEVKEKEIATESSTPRNDETTKVEENKDERPS